MEGPSPRVRGWCWTINNPQQIDDDHIDQLKSRVQYFTYGKETGETGTYHYQGYLYFKHPQRFITIKSILGRAHIEPQKGSIDQAIEYCQKDGDWIEWGDRPEENRQNQKLQWSTIITKAENGELNWIKENHPRTYMIYKEKLMSLCKPSTMILSNLENEWWYGPTGTGKSSKIWQDHPEHYKKKINKWWDGYYQQDVVVIEEWDPSHSFMIHHLKIWSDRYPFSAEIKNGNLQGIRPKKIIITSNFTMEQCFPNTQDLEPLKRRFKAIHFPTPIHPTFVPDYNWNNILDDDETRLFIQELADHL